MLHLAASIAAARQVDSVVLADLPQGHHAHKDRTHEDPLLLAANHYF